MKLEKDDLLGKAETAIRKCFENISFLEINEIIRGIKQGRVSADLWVKLKAVEGYPDLAVIVRKKGEQKFIRESVNQLLSYLEYVPNTYGLIVAPFITKKSAEICKGAGIGYMDLIGNCYLDVRNVYIEKEGRANDEAEKRVLKSLYYPKAERILRVLLNNPGKSWKMAGLTAEAGVSLGMVSKVKQRLQAVEWIETQTTGFNLTKWKELLAEWQTQYRYTKNEIFNFYSLKSEAYIKEQLSEYCKKNNIRYALSLFSGASLVAPYTRFNRFFAYVEQDVDRIKEALDLKPVSSGANITLLLPYDAGVFYGLQEYNGTPVVSAIQLYLDLINFKGRGEEAARFLFEKVIQAQWSQKQISDSAK